MEIVDNLDQEKVGQIVALNYRAAQVFEKYGIGFCCKGGITIAKACENHRVNLQTVLDELKASLREKNAIPFAGLNLSELAAYIVKHHAFVERSIPPLKALLAKIVTVHGERHPELAVIEHLFNETAGALRIHMKKEEFILFPYIKALELAFAGRVPMPNPSFGHIDKPIAMMEHEHDTEGERFARIAVLSDNYTPPADACQTYTTAFRHLKDFEQDLHTHIHLENNVLFPKARTMYRHMVGQDQITSDNPYPEG